MAYTDDFTGLTSGTALPTYSANWATPTGATSCAGNAAGGAYRGANSGAFSVNYWNATFASAHYAKAAVTTPAGGESVGVAVRIQSNAVSFFSASLDGTTLYVGQVIDGSWSQWGTHTGFVNGDVIELSIDQDTTTTVYLKQNGSTVATYTGKDALSGGYAGIACYNTSGDQVGDDWEGGDVGGTQSNAPRAAAYYRMMRNR